MLCLSFLIPSELGILMTEFGNLWRAVGWRSLGGISDHSGGSEYQWDLRRGFIGNTWDH